MSAHFKEIGNTVESQLSKLHLSNKSVI